MATLQLLNNIKSNYCYTLPVYNEYTVIIEIEDSADDTERTHNIKGKILYSDLIQNKGNLEDLNNDDVKWLVKNLDGKFKDTYENKGTLFKVVKTFLEKYTILTTDDGIDVKDLYDLYTFTDGGGEEFTFPAFKRQLPTGINYKYNIVTAKEYIDNMLDNSEVKVIVEENSEVKVLVKLHVTYLRISDCNKVQKYLVTTRDLYGRFVIIQTDTGICVCGELIPALSSLQEIGVDSETFKSRFKECGPLSVQGNTIPFRAREHLNLLKIISKVECQ